MAGESQIGGDYCEAIIDFKNPKESYTKEENVKNGRVMMLIMANFTCLLIVSMYNFWQFRILTQLD